MQRIDIALETSAEEADLVARLGRVATQNTAADFAKMNEFFEGHTELGLDRVSFIIDQRGHAYLSEVVFRGLAPRPHGSNSASTRALPCTRGQRWALTALAGGSR
jgi:hypothetical protein